MYAFLEKIAQAVVGFVSGWHIDQFVTSLSYMAYGMGGIFIVVLIIGLVIYLLNKLPGDKNTPSH